MEGRQPLAVSTKGDSMKEAVSSAIDKMTNAMNKIVGKMQEH